MTVPHSYNAKELADLLRRHLKRCGSLESPEEHDALLAAADTLERQDSALEVYRAVADSSSGPESEAEAACAAMVKWCDKNDWGSVPKKLELQMRKACRATPQQPDCDRIDGCCTNPTLCAREKRCRND
jgi:hypothetical protein